MIYTNINRDEFCDAFHFVFTNAEIIDLESKCQGHTRVGHFYLYYNEDEFYFIDLDTGVMVQYYKHLGRCNHINDEFTVEDLIEFLMDLRKELQNENIQG